MAEEPIATDSAVDKIKKAEYRTPDGLARGLSSEQRTDVKARKRPPCHDCIGASHYAVHGNLQVPCAPTEGFYVSL